MPKRKTRVGEALRKAMNPPLPPPHLIVDAKAGSGKTTTMIEGLKFMRGEKPSITPSPQQQAIWEQMILSRDANSVCMVAFNVIITDELKRRVPAGVDAMTMNAMGNRAVYKAFGRQEPSNFATRERIAELLDVDSRVLQRTRPTLLASVNELVNLCKQNLVQPDGDVISWDMEMHELISHYDVQIEDKERVEVFQLVPDVLELCKQPKGMISFVDQIWLPVVLNLPLFRYDLLIVDEAQDLNRCQQALAKRAGRRLILVGDPHQAIYGFAGADAESMKRMEKELLSDWVGLNENVDNPNRCVVLPLSVTRRCGKAIVKEAQRIVPDFDAHESNCVGEIRTAPYDNQKFPAMKTYHEQVRDGDMLLCRVNAPLVSQCFRFIKMGRKATIRGRDIGTGLIKTVEKMQATSIPDLVTKLSDWANQEEAKEAAKRNPSENRLIAIRDRVDCLLCFLDGAKTVQAVIDKITAIFVDNQSEGIRLSSIHKAKGLEADRVFFLMPKGGECPHPMAKTPWQREQELNLKYVAITRAIKELVYFY